MTKNDFQGKLGRHAPRDSRGRPSSGRWLSAKRPRLADTLERLRLTLGVSTREWAEILDISVPSYADIKEGREEVSLSALENVTREFDLSLESFMAGDLDFRAAAARFRGDLGYLPERYQIGAFSYRRSALNPLNYVEEFFGWETRLQALRRLQVDEAVFSKLDERISMQFTADLCSYLESLNCHPDEFFAMGAYSVVTNQNSPIPARLQKARSLKELHDIVIHECLTRFVERNCFYRLASSDSEGCVIEAPVNPELTDALQGRKAGSPHICMYKLGVIAAFPGYVGLPFSSVVETSCVHRGDSVCRYEADFSRATQSAKDPSWRSGYSS
jgi:hypothetical protein